MKILLLTTHLNAGGITSYLLTLAKGLIENGQDVFVASSGGNMEHEFIKCGAHNIVFNIKTKSELSPKIYMALPRLRKIILEKQIDIVHAQTRITQVMGTLLGSLCDVTYLSTCHGFFQRKWSRALFPCWGDGVIAISEAVKEHLKNDFGVSGERVFMVRNGIDLKEFPVITEEQRKVKRQAFGLTDNFVVGIIARLSDVKGHAVLLDAMAIVAKEIPEARLFVVGTGKEEYALKEKVKALNLDACVTFFQKMSCPMEFFPLFDVFVMPSLQEGLGLSVMEAQAVGVTVIASNVGGIPDLIDDEKTGILVGPNNPRQLAEAILKLKKYPLMREELRDNALCCRLKYSASKMVERTLDVYKRLNA